MGPGAWGVGSGAWGWRGLVDVPRGLRIFHDHPLLEVGVRIVLQKDCVKRTVKGLGVEAPPGGQASTDRWLRPAKTTLWLCGKRLLAAQLLEGVVVEICGAVIRHAEHCGTLSLGSGRRLGPSL